MPEKKADDMLGANEAKAPPKKPWQWGTKATRLRLTEADKAPFRRIVEEVKGVDTLPAAIREAGRYWAEHHPGSRDNPCDLMDSSGNPEPPP